MAKKADLYAFLMYAVMYTEEGGMKAFAVVAFPKLRLCSVFELRYLQYIVSGSQVLYSEFFIPRSASADP